MTLPRSVALCLLTATLGPSAGSGPRESTEVLRAQVELSVCDARNAGTDDPVSASLGAGAVTWLDHPGRDLERGGRYRYDLLLDGVGSLADIRGLTISKVGADDLCLAELRLIVNGSTIFVRAFAGGTWLERDLASSAAELRANAAWQSYGWSMSEWVAKTGAAVSRGELLERLESGIASARRAAPGQRASARWRSRTTP